MESLFALAGRTGARGHGGDHRRVTHVTRESLASPPGSGVRDAFAVRSNRSGAGGLHNRIHAHPDSDGTCVGGRNGNGRRWCDVVGYGADQRVELDFATRMTFVEGAGAPKL